MLLIEALPCTMPENQQGNVSRAYVHQKGKRKKWNANMPLRYEI